MTSYTQTPNDLFTAVPDMSEPELKITLALIRATYGFHRDDCTMTYKDFHNDTGMVSKSSVARGIRDVLKRSENGGGFFVKSGKSQYSKVQKVYSQSTVSVLPDEPKVQKVYSQSTVSVLPDEPKVQKVYSQSTVSVPPTSSPKEIYKESIYIYHEDTFLLTEMRAAVSAISKETWAMGINDDVFDNLANALLKQEATPADVAKFGEWWGMWKPEGHRPPSYNGPQWAYFGKPALTTILNQWSAFKDRETEKPRKVQVAIPDPDSLYIPKDNYYLPG